MVCADGRLSGEDKPTVAMLATFAEVVVEAVAPVVVVVIIVIVVVVVVVVVADGAVGSDTSSIDNPRRSRLRLSRPVIFGDNETMSWALPSVESSTSLGTAGGEERPLRLFPLVLVPPSSVLLLELLFLRWLLRVAMESLLSIANGAESSVQGVTILTLSPPIVESDTIFGTFSKCPTTGPRASSGISSSLRFGISSKVTNQRTEGCSISTRDSLPIIVVLL